MAIPLKRSKKDVAILRNSIVLTSFLGVFGSDLKEVRLTSTLGYLIAQTPEEFKKLFKLKNDILSVNVEEREEAGRVDIKIRTAKENIDLEAKVNTIDATVQSQKYAGKHKILLSNHIPSLRQRKSKRIQYVNWDEVHNVLKVLSTRNFSSVKFIATEIIKYLQSHHVISMTKPIEIYLREINDEASLNLFLKSGFYCCDYKSNSNLYKAIYFAPHFGLHIEQEHAGIQCGISYIARIERLEVVDDWKHLSEVIRKVRGQLWVRKNKQYLDKIHHNWVWGNNRRIIFFLAKPINIFNPAIKKSNLQAGTGRLSKSFLSFDELFRARSEKI